MIKSIKSDKKMVAQNEKGCIFALASPTQLAPD